MVLSFAVYMIAYFFGFGLLLLGMLVFEESTRHDSLSHDETTLLTYFWGFSVLMSVVGPWWLSELLTVEFSLWVVLLSAVTGFFQSAMVGPWFGPMLIRMTVYSEE